MYCMPCIFLYRRVLGYICSVLYLLVLSPLSCLCLRLFQIQKYPPPRKCLADRSLFLGLHELTLAVHPTLTLTSNLNPNPYPNPQEIGRLFFSRGAAPEWSRLHPCLGEDTRQSPISRRKSCGSLRVQHISMKPKFCA